MRRSDVKSASRTDRDLDQLEASVAQGPGQVQLYRNLIRRSGVAITAAESWVLWHLGARGPISVGALARRLDVEPAGLGELFEALGRRGYVQLDRQGVPDLTSKGRRALVALVRAGQERIARLIRGREPADTRERTRVLRRLTHGALKSMPT